MKTQEGPTTYKPKRKASEEAIMSMHLNVKLLVSRIVRKYFCGFSHQVVVLRAAFEK